MFFCNTIAQRLGSDRRRADGVRVEKLPKIRYIGNSRRDPEDNDF